MPSSEATATRRQRRGLFSALDWRPKTMLARTLIVFLLVTPLIGAITFMWAMWDPSQYLHSTKLAVVNEDDGAERDGEQNNYGDQVVEGLAAADYLAFEEVSREDADQGLVTGEYLFVMNIPEDFSTNVLSVMSEEPVQPTVTIAYNDYNGSNQALLTSGLVPQIQAQVASSIAEGYSQEIIGGINELGDGLRAAADGAGQLDDGATQLKDGTTQAKDGVGQLDDGATQLHDGTTRLTDGTTRLKDGTTQLTDGIGQLQGGTQQLGDGAAQIDDGVGQLTGLLIPLLEQVQSVAPALQPVIDLLHGVGQHEQAAQLEGIVGRFNANNPDNMVAQLNKLKNGTAEMRYNLNDPSAPYLNGVNRLADGIYQLDDGATELSDGATQLHDGTTRLKDGTTRLKDGSAQLDDGTTRLKDGTGELSTRLEEGAGRAPTFENVDGSAKQAAAPVAFDETNLHPVTTNIDVNDPTAKEVTSGISLILVVVIGFLIMALTAMLVPHVTGRWSRSRSVGPVLKAFGALSLINFVTVCAMGLISTFMGWSPASWLATGVVFALIAMAGAASYQFFRALFGRVIGGIFSLGMYGYGVLVFGGVWPQPIIPQLFRFFHPTSPMTYARYGFIRATDGRWDATFWAGIAGLLFFILVPLALTIVVRVARINGFAREQDELMLREEDDFYAEQVDAHERERERVSVGAGIDDAPRDDVAGTGTVGRHAEGGGAGGASAAGFGAAGATGSGRDRAAGVGDAADAETTGRLDPVDAPEKGGGGKRRKAERDRLGRLLRRRK